MAKDLSESLEDCLEAVLHLENEHRVARMSDIAARLGVKTPSANAAVKKLTRRGLVKHESYGYVTLTGKGRRTAKAVAERHEALENFLRKILKVPSSRAAIEACRLEHALSPDTVTKLNSLTRRLLGGEKGAGKGKRSNK
ncbi:MAG: metal-dependent transcriptional regulator [Planctomycetota bacterium]|jgi:DtxR family Mn-dependent transcriptional regulator